MTTLRKTRPILWAAALLLLLSTAGPAVLADETTTASDYVQFEADSGHLYWDQLRAANGFRVVITDPHGRESATWDFTKSPSVSLAQLHQAFSSVPDGCYSWDVYAELALDGKTLGQLEALRQAGEPMPVWWHEEVKDTVQSGTFWIVEGAIVFDTDTEDSPDELTVSPEAGRLDALARGVPGGPDLLSIQESLCVGRDCLTSETFGFDTVRLKENNLRIHFDDTSTLSAYPSRDWRIGTNDSFNGGASHFRLVDVSANHAVFTIEAEAARDSLVVDSSGNVGLGTANPAVELQLTSNNEPILRLDQTNASGFEPQVWDVAGHETFFYVRDVTHFVWPFRIYPGSPTNALVLNADGEIGIGRSFTDASVDINGVDTGTSALSMDFGNSSTGVTWFFQNDQDGTFKISREGTGGAEITVRERADASGNATLFVDGSIQATNVSFSSSRDLKTAFKTVDPVEILERLAGIPILHWRYKTEDEGVRHLGPVAEEFMAAFGLGTDARRISVTDVNGVALAAIQGLHQGHRELEDAHEALSRSQQEIDTRLAALEERLANR